MLGSANGKECEAGQTVPFEAKGISVNLKEGTRRLALLLGAIGALVGGLASYIHTQDVLSTRNYHDRFEKLANSDVVQQERKGQAGWVSIDPKTGERIRWDQQVDKRGIKVIHWSKDNEIESIETDSDWVYPTPAPSSWSYLLIALLPIFGFLIPWGAVRAIGWVLAGFTHSAR